MPSLCEEVSRSASVVQAAAATAQQATAALAACQEERSRLAHGKAALQRQLNEQQVAAEELRQQVRPAQLTPLPTPWLIPRTPSQQTPCCSMQGNKVG